MDHLVHWQGDGLSGTSTFFRKLAGFGELALGVLDLGRDRVDADQLIDVAARLGVTLEPDSIAFNQELQDHILDELG